jgi:hypothetical protein
MAGSRRGPISRAGCRHTAPIRSASGTAKIISRAVWGPAAARAAGPGSRVCSDARPMKATGFCRRRGSGAWRGRGRYQSACRARSEPGGLDDRVREAKGPQVAGQSRPRCRGRPSPAQLDSGFEAMASEIPGTQLAGQAAAEELLGRSVTATRPLSASTWGRCGLAATAQWLRLASRRLPPFVSTHRAWPGPTRRGGRRSLVRSPA